jgi:hypothetical protein
MTKVESVETLLSPSLRVSRPVAACSRCRGAKIKCDGKLPACSACERSGKASTCSGANDEFAKGRERSYVAALEGASERLQRRIAQLKSATDLTPFSPAGISTTRPTISTHQSASQSSASSKRANRKEASDMDDLVGDFGFLSVNATSRDFHGFTSTMSFARLLLSVSLVQELPKTVTIALPPRHIALVSIQHYLDFMFVLMPFFSEMDLLSSLSAVYNDSVRSVKPSDHWFVHMVLAITAAMSSKSQGDNDYRRSVGHAAAAFEHADSVLHPGAISGVQAILLLLEYSLLMPEYFRCWDLIGMASRVMVDLGLHVDPSSEAKIAKDALDMRRRVFASVYILDRYISLAYGRAFSFTDDSPDVSLPFTSKSTDPRQASSNELFLRSLQPSQYLLEVRHIHSRFHQASNFSSKAPWAEHIAAAETASAINNIYSWSASIPASLSTQHITFFRLESLYSQILVLLPSYRIPLGNQSYSNKRMLFELTIEYTDQIQPVTQNPSQAAFMSFIDIIRVNTIGRHFREALWSDFDDLISAKGKSSATSSPEISYAQLHLQSHQMSTPLERCTRAIRCLHNIINILDYARRLWGMSSMREKFEQESAVLLGKLANKQQQWSELPTLPASNTPRHQVPTMQDSLHSTNNATLQPYPPLFRSQSQEYPVQQPRLYGLPQGSQPRRSYEFMGGSRGQG